MVKWQKWKKVASLIVCQTHYNFRFCLGVNWVFLVPFCLKFYTSLHFSLRSVPLCIKFKASGNQKNSIYPLTKRKLQFVRKKILFWNLIFWRKCRGIQTLISKIQKRCYLTSQSVGILKRVFPTVSIFIFSLTLLHFAQLCIHLRPFRWGPRISPTMQISYIQVLYFLQFFFWKTQASYLLHFL